MNNRLKVPANNATVASGFGERPDVSRQTTNAIERGNIRSQFAVAGVQDCSTVRPKIEDIFFEPIRMRNRFTTET